MTATRPFQILLVEDSDGDADLAAERLNDLKDFEHELHRAGTLSAAVAALAARPFDAVVLDLNLPDSTGIETLRRLRGVSSVLPGCSAALVVLSGNTDDELRRLTLREGAQDFIGKDEYTARLLARSVLFALERQRVQESQLQLQRLVSSNPDAVVVTDPTGVVRFVNQAAIDLFGKPRESFLGERLGFSTQEGNCSEIDIVRGHTRLIGEMRVVHFEWRGEPAVLATIRDVTEHRKLASDRDHLLEYLRLQIERMPLGYLLSGPDFRYTAWNPAAERIFGFTEAEVLGRHPFELIVPPVSRPTVGGIFDRLRAGDMDAHGACENVTKDGRAVTCEWTNTPLFGPDGAFLGILSLVQDVSERVRLEASLSQSQKMEALGQLAGGVAHDFNNMLTVINGYSELLLDSVPPDHPARDGLREIKQAGERSAALTRQLLLFSRRQLAAPQLVKVNALVNDLARMLRRLIGEDIRLGLSLRAVRDEIKADPGQLEQALLNLVVNARDAMPTGGRLTIETESVIVGAEDLDPSGSGVIGPHVVISVSDSGLGMLPEVRSRIFEPFFTTKGVGRGTGLGLAVVHGVVKQAGGRIEVDSDPGRGTTFRIFLPNAAIDADAPRTAKPPAPVLTGGDETILLVEDEAGVRSLTRRLLAGVGYTVLEASGGAEAMRIATGHSGTIHLLLTDVVMPELGGRKLSEQFLALRPEAKVLFISGYTDDAVVRHGVLHDSVAFLQKPFTVATLAEKVRETLDGTHVRRDAPPPPTSPTA